MSTVQCLALAAVLAVLAPFARGADDLATVQGKVTFKGAPLAGVKVTFHLGGGQFAGAKSAEDGTFKVERLPTGKHAITVEAAAKGAKAVALPAKFADEGTSGLRLDVKKGTSNFDIDLR